MDSVSPALCELRRQVWLERCPHLEGDTFAEAAEACARFSACERVSAA
jgi:hypothetical protein